MRKWWKVSSLCAGYHSCSLSAARKTLRLIPFSLPRSTLSYCMNNKNSLLMIGNGIGSQTVAPSNYIAFLWQVNLALWEAKKAVSVEQDAVRSCFCQNCHRYPKNERQIDKRNCFPTKRCAWRCMDLEEDGGTCNAILYDRESKVENDTN